MGIRILTVSNEFTWDIFFSLGENVAKGSIVERSQITVGKLERNFSKRWGAENPFSLLPSNNTKLSLFTRVISIPEDIIKKPSLFLTGTNEPNFFTVPVSQRYGLNDQTTTQADWSHSITSWQLYDWFPSLSQIPKAGLHEDNYINHQSPFASFKIQILHCDHLWSAFIANYVQDSNNKRINFLPVWPLQLNWPKFTNRIGLLPGLISSRICSDLGWPR